MPRGDVLRGPPSARAAACPGTPSACSCIMMNCSCPQGPGVALVEPDASLGHLLTHLHTVTTCCNAGEREQSDPRKRTLRELQHEQCPRHTACSNECTAHLGHEQMWHIVVLVPSMRRPSSPMTGRAAWTMTASMRTSRTSLAIDDAGAGQRPGRGGAGRSATRSRGCHVQRNDAQPQCNHADGTANAVFEFAQCQAGSSNAEGSQCTRAATSGPLHQHRRRFHAQTHRMSSSIQAAQLGAAPALGQVRVEPVWREPTAALPRAPPWLLANIMAGTELKSCCTSSAQLNACLCESMANFWSESGSDQRWCWRLFAALEITSILQLG
jgi:hypothetical protein